ncbi:MAG: hypothetical protein R3288_04320 [Woeseiaceae bacterium]|nr:hypothetical protein [Woeseiaceae bacterium]
MARTKTTTGIAVLAAALALGACGKADEPADEGAIAVTEPRVTFTPKGEPGATAKPSGPITIGYRIIGKPVVGQPVAIELAVVSTFGNEPVQVSYRINDRTAMQLADSQAATVTVSPTADERASLQQVTVIPMRDGRLYLNVSASVATDNGTMSTVTAIPIQVGEGTRTLQQQGELVTDDDGTTLRVLPGDDS